MTPPTPLRALIVDDEPLAIDRLDILLSRMAAITVVGSATDGEIALRMIEVLAPDLVLLDISMPSMDGMTVARAIQRAASPPVVIFCTAFDQFAVEAFDVAAVDYILKPATVERLERAIARARMIMLSPATSTSAVRDRIDEFWVPHRSEVVRIAATEIDRVEAERDYMRLHVGSRSFLLHQTISELERRLAPEQFMRLHRSSIVRRDFVSRLRRDGLGNWYAGLKDGGEIRIGRSYVAAARGLAGR